jgi:biopolymer transport protein ExbB
METSLGFGHFLTHTDGIARFILALMLIMSVGTWYLIATKGAQAIRSQKKSAEFLAAFWAAPSLDAVARHLRQTGVTEAFSHLVHHGFTAIEQHKAGRETRGLVDAGTPDEFLTRALKRAIAQDKSRLEYGQTFLATVASSAPFVGLFGTVWGIYHALMAIGMSGQGTLDKVAGPRRRGTDHDRRRPRRGDPGGRGLQRLRPRQSQYAGGAELLRPRLVQLPCHGLEEHPAAG